MNQEESKQPEKVLHLINSYNISGNHFIWNDSSQSYKLAITGPGDNKLVIECGKGHSVVPGHPLAPKGIDLKLIKQTYDEVHIIMFFNNEPFRVWYIGPITYPKFPLINIWQPKDESRLLTFKGLLYRARLNIEIFSYKSGVVIENQWFKYSISSGKNDGGMTNEFQLQSKEFFEDEHQVSYYEENDINNTENKPSVDNVICTIPSSGPVFGANWDISVVDDDDDHNHDKQGNDGVINKSNDVQEEEEEEEEEEQIEEEGDVQRVSQDDDDDENDGNNNVHSMLVDVD